MENSTAKLYQFTSSDTVCTTDGQTPKTTPGLIAMAASLVGDENKVKEQMRCSEADFLLYCSGEKELPLPELERLISLIIHEQGVLIAEHAGLLAKIRAKRMCLQP